VKFVTNVTVLGLSRGTEFDTGLTEYLVTLVGSGVISIIQEKAAAPVPVDTGALGAPIASPASRKKPSAPRKRAGGTGTRKRAAKKAGGLSDVV
jgi:hypothetical protein